VPAAISSATVRARAAAIAGLPASGFGDVTALNLEIKADATALHDDMILSCGHYQRAVEVAPVSAGVQTGALPSTFYLPQTAHFVAAGAQGAPVELEQWEPAYLTECLSLPQQRGYPRWFDVTAGLSGLNPVDQWVIWPVPDRAGTLYVTYTQSVVFPVSGGELLIYAGSGWEDFLVYALAIKMLGAEETHDHPYVAEREKHRQRAKDLAMRRHAGPPARTPLRPPVSGSRSRLNRYPTFRT
jgi:hypothetical protein